MLEHLGPFEFEDWCKLVMERQFGCRVELTRRSGDEGRDLIVHHSEGPIVVECKHYPNGSVGRPVVQKLHSAMLTYGSQRGLILTTGRFSEEARQYLAKLQGVKVQLVDGTQLGVMAQRAGIPLGQSGRGNALSIPTTPSASFRQSLLRSIFTPERFAAGRNASPTNVQVVRRTDYASFYTARFTAEGSTKTAVGTKNASWAGALWFSGDGTKSGNGKPPGLLSASPEPQDLAYVLDATPGAVPDPELQYAAALGTMREHLARNLVKQVSYTGGNNVSYTKDIVPSKSSIQLNDVQLLYVPSQSLRIDGFGQLHEGRLEQTTASYRIHIPSLAACTTCGGRSHAGNQVFCAVCHHSSHAKTFLHPDSFRCMMCKATLCRRHTRKKDRNFVCPACAPADAKPLLPRWLGPLLISTLAVLSIIAYDAMQHPVDRTMEYVAAAIGLLPLFLRVWPWGLELGTAPLEYPIVQAPVAAPETGTQPMVVLKPKTAPSQTTQATKAKA